MVKATFNGDAENTAYQCDEFNAKVGNMVFMPNERWATIGAEGKQGLFTLIEENELPFPEQRTVGPKA